jgi:RNA polymerase sigma-70 factor (sigma-E family)
MMAPMAAEDAVLQGPDEGDVLVALYDAQYRSLVRLASLLVDDIGTCEELVQDAFVAVWRQRGRLYDPAKLPAYLRSAVLNGARSHLRKTQVRRRHVLPLPGSAPAAEVGGVAATETDRVLGALRALPDRQREVLALRYYLDLSEAEIAHTLGISAGSVKTHASRGLAALATALEER